MADSFTGTDKNDAYTYESKPVTCVAVQFTGADDEKLHDLKNWIEQRGGWRSNIRLVVKENMVYPDIANLWVLKSQAWCTINQGDYIIAEPDGQGFYPCAKDIFEARWVKVQNDNAPTLDMPGYEGSVGPFKSQYGQPHVYARDVHSGSGNCVCGAHLGHHRHTEAAPGLPVPDWAR